MIVKRLINLPKDKHFFLFGPRQTGKSTWIEHLFHVKDSVYYNLLNSDTYQHLIMKPQVLRKEIDYQLSVKKIKHVIVDEIQKIPQLLDEIHSLIEEKRDYNFILSGSSARKLKRCHANMLGGRAQTHHLYPFIYNELKGLFSLDTALQFGTLPGVYLEPEPKDKQEILRSYVNTYIKEEIELEAQLRNLSGFLRFLSLAASQNTEIVNYTNIARDSGVSYQTVKEYYKILEDTLIGFFLMPFGRSIRKKLIKHPKFYFFDTGVVNAINRTLRLMLVENTYEYGRLFESFIINEIVRLNEYNRLDLSLSFYRTERAAEVDCVIETPFNKIIALEIKSTENPVQKHCRGLYSFKKVVKNAELILASRIPRPIKQDGILFLPWREVLEYIASF